METPVKTADEAAPAALKLLGSSIALIVAFLGAAGFLSVRSYLSGLGIPEHASISVDSYIQYGGRFIFVLLLHALPIGLVLCVLLVIVTGAQRRVAWFDHITARAPYTALFIDAAALFTIILELSVLATNPIFYPGHVRLGLVSSQLRIGLYVIEMGVAITVSVFVSSYGRIQALSRGSLFGKPLVWATSLLLVVQLALLPVSFGRTALVPRSFQQATLHMGKQSTVLSGIIIFSDADKYFLYTDHKRLVEVKRDNVEEIDYGELRRMEDLSQE